MINGFVFYPLTYSNIFQIFPLFQQLPLEILDFVLSFLKHEDILMLQDCLPRVQHCPRYKRLVKQAGAELGQAQLKLGLGFTSTNFH